MKVRYVRLMIAMFALAIGSVSITACYRNPVTGRASLSLVDEATMLNLSNQQYASFLASNQVVTGTAGSEMVRKVGLRMATAVNEYFRMRGRPGEVGGYTWEFRLVNNAQANAWCLPGGKIVVYTGILPITQTEGGMAAVMGHEIAHAIARHGSERMSQSLLQQYGGAALSTFVSDKPAQAQALFNTAYGVTSTLGSLAHSRAQESEADEMGLYFMAMAGYNPNEAIGFWQRMGSIGGTRPPEFLSTHPNDNTRIVHLRQMMPRAMGYYSGTAVR